MKKVWNKVMAYMLVFVMCFSAGNVPVYAKENTATEIMTENEEASEVVTESIFDGDNFKVTYTLSSYWDTGYNANIKIENTGDSTMEN